MNPSVVITAGAVQISWGDVTTGDGWAMNVPVSTTPITLPAVGSSNGAMFNHAGGFTINNVRFILDGPLSGSASLSCVYTDVTQSLSALTAIISSGNQTAEVGVSPAIDVVNGDQLQVTLSLSSGSMVIPYIQWDIDIN